MQNENLPQVPPKSSFKFIFSMMGLGMVITVAVVSIYMPRMILWYFDPPTNNGVSCVSSIQWAVNKLLIAQAWSVGVGAIIGLFVGSKLRKKK